MPQTPLKGSERLPNETAAQYRARMQAIGEAARQRHLSESLRRPRNYDIGNGSKASAEKKPAPANRKPQGGGLYDVISNALSGNRR